MPEFTDYSMTNRTYRYYGGEPLYPFGYGLTYGECTVTGLEADGNADPAGTAAADGFTAVVRVKNNGPHETDARLQLSLKDEDSPSAPPNPVLCGFKRIRLAAGEEKAVTVTLRADAFTVVNADGLRIRGSGRWTLYAGFGGPDPKTEKLTGRKCISLSIQEAGIR